MITLTEQDVRRRLLPAELIPALESAFRDRYPHCQLPVRTHIPTKNGVFLYMACYDGLRHSLGVKMVAVNDGAAQPGDHIQANYFLLDPRTAEPLLNLPANYLTDLRTAATSALATRFLARSEARILGIFGAGRQARSHARLLPTVRRFEKILICSLDSAQAPAFAEEISRELKLPATVTDAASLVTESDVICTCTTSHQPLFDGNILRPGTHINAVGAFQPHTREVDSICVERARLYVDTYDATLAEAGEILIPIKEGRLTNDHIIADLHELVSGMKPARTRPDDITLFKSVGCALEDLVAAELLLR